MITRQLRYFVEKAFQNIRQFLLINFITIGIISLSLIVLGTFLLVFLNLRGHVDTWENQIQVTAYLKDTITEDELEALTQTITRLPGVKETKYTSKREALTYLKQAFPDQAAALAGLKENPLPASVDISLEEDFHTLEKIESIAARVEDIVGVEEVEYGRSWLEKYAGFLRLVKAGALVVGTVIVLATIFIISNTIKLTVYARKEEIEIMRLVGATNAFIRTPFFIEGMLQGLLGALVALGVLAACFCLFTHWLAQSSLLPFHRMGLFFLPVHYALFIIGGGMLTGLLGSFFSLGRYLRV